MHLAFILILVVLGQCSCGRLHRPRGVSASRAVLYPPGENFTCFNGLRIIKFKQINDDFCDCEDGSDEPGTSACQQGFFDCVNIGYHSSSIPSSRVNDGICDCCDGSDEFKSKAICENQCLKLAKKLRNSIDRHHQQLALGYEMFKEYCKKGEEIKKEVLKTLEALDMEKKDLFRLRLQLEVLKLIAEKAELNAKEEFNQKWHACGNEIPGDEIRSTDREIKFANEALLGFLGLDANRDNILSAEELLLHTEFDADGDGNVSMEEAKLSLGDRESVDFDSFKSSVWSNIRTLLRQHASTDTQQQQPGEGHEEGEGEEVAANSEVSAVDYDERTNAAVKVANKSRQEFNEVSERLSVVESNIASLNNMLFVDVGAAVQFWPLATRCLFVSNIADSFTYTLCPFHNVTRHPDVAGSATLLGKWSRWSGVDSDKSIMVYEQGESCPKSELDRLAKVHIKCGTTDTLSVNYESSECECELTLTTPAGCSQPPPSVIPDPFHYEL